MADVRLTPRQDAAAPGWTDARSTVLRGLLGAAATAAALGVFWAALRRLGPDSAGVPTFSSDSAIPILMANQTQWGLGQAYYAGQDRFGAWPFWLAHLLASALHQPVTPQLLHGLATAVLLSGAVPAALLCRRAPGLVLLAYAISVLAPQTRVALFDFQPYPWQIPLLLWAWWSIRGAAASQAHPAPALWLLLATLLCFLATWTSTLSGPLLLGLTLLEDQAAPARPGARPRRRLPLLLVPAAVGLLAEEALRLAYRRYLYAHLGDSGQLTDVHVDSGHLLANAASVWMRLKPAPVLGALGVLTACSGWVVARCVAARRRPTALQCTLLGAWLLAVLPLPLLAAVRHVRLNDFLPRYFAPSYVFAYFGALVALSVWVPSRLRGYASLCALGANTLALGLLAYHLRPQDGVNPEYARLQRTAQRLAQAAPGAMLLDGYWGTYVFAGLAPPGQLQPLPCSGELNRLPALALQLAQAPKVLVGHRRLLGMAAGSEPAWLFQYGVLLQRDQPDFLSDGVDRFSSYHPTPVQTLRFSSQPLLPSRSLDAAGIEVTLRLDEARAGTAAVVEVSCLALQTPARAWAEGPAQARLPVQVWAVPGAVFFLLPEDALVQALHVGFAPQPCRLRGAAWFVPPPGHP